MANIDLSSFEDNLKNILQSNSTIVNNTSRINTGMFDIGSVRGIQLYVKAEPYQNSTESRLLNARRYEIPVNVHMVCRSRTLNNLHSDIRDLYPEIEETIQKNNRLNGISNGIISYDVEPYEIGDENGNPEAYILTITVLYDFILTL